MLFLGGGGGNKRTRERAVQKHPKGPKIGKKKSHLKISASLEISILTFRFPHKKDNIRVWWAACLTSSIPKGNLELFQSRSLRNDNINSRQ